MDQPSLFDWTPPTADVTPFPCNRRVGKVRRAAEKLRSSTDKAGEAYWRRTITSLDNQMRKAGVSEERIDAELGAFFAAVELEINRLAMAERNSKPGGAA